MNRSLGIILLEMQKKKHEYFEKIEESRKIEEKEKYNLLFLKCVKIMDFVRQNKSLWWRTEYKKYKEGIR
jgi:hypothetical protein